MDVVFLWIGRVVCIASGIGLMSYLLFMAARWPIQFMFTLNEYRNREDMRIALDLFREHNPVQFLRFAERNHLKLTDAMRQRLAARINQTKGGA